MVLAIAALAEMLLLVHLRKAAIPILALGVLAASLLHTVHPAWARREYGARMFSVRMPDMPPNSLVIVHAAPLAYLLPFIRSPGWSAVSVSHFSQPGYYVFAETKRRVAEHSGPIFILYVHLEKVWYQSHVTDLGVVWHMDRCRPIESNMSWGLSLCDARKK